MNVEMKGICIEHTVPASGKPSVSLEFFTSALIKQDQKVTLSHRDVYRRGYYIDQEEKYMGICSQ